MKALKIGIVIAVLGGIGYYIWQSLAITEEKPVIIEADNQFVEKIEKEIKTLSEMPTGEFCGDFYKNIQFRIDDWSKQKHFGVNDKENEHWQDVLSRDLYSAYAPKFILQTFVVFSRSDWEISKREFIANEANKLLQSAYLDQSNSVRIKLEEIKTILRKYNEVQSFIFNLNSYLDSSPFEIETSKKWLDDVNNLKRNNLGNTYVNNCSHFHEALNSAPQKAYSKHLNFVRSRASAKSGAYKNSIYTGETWAQKAADYRDKIYDPIMEDITFLQNNANTLYGVSAFSDLNNVKSRWDNELVNAIQYFKESSGN